MDVDYTDHGEVQLLLASLEFQINCRLCEYDIYQQQKPSLVELKSEFEKFEFIKLRIYLNMLK